MNNWIRELFARAPIHAEPPEIAYLPEFYVEREESQHAQSVLFTGKKSAVLWGPRFCGKSWILQDLLRHLRQEDQATVYIDLGTFDPQLFQSFDAFVNALAAEILRSLYGKEEQLDLTRAFSLSPSLALTQFIGQLLSTLQKPLTLAFDRADSVVDSPLQNDLFTLFRSWTEKSLQPDSSQVGSWGQLRLLYAIATLPTELMTHDFNASPFNIAHQIFVGNFTPPQVGALLKKYDLYAGSGEQELLMQALDGQPFLTHGICRAAASTQMPLSKILEQAVKPGGMLFQFAEMQLDYVAKQPHLLQILQRCLPLHDAPLDRKTYYSFYLAGLADGNHPNTLHLALPYYHKVLPSLLGLAQYNNLQ